MRRVFRALYCLVAVGTLAGLPVLIIDFKNHDWSVHYKVRSRSPRRQERVMLKRRAKAAKRARPAFVALAHVPVSVMAQLHHVYLMRAGILCGDDIRAAQSPGQPV